MTYKDPERQAQAERKRQYATGGKGLLDYLLGRELRQVVGKQSDIEDVLARRRKGKGGGTASGRYDPAAAAKKAIEAGGLSGGGYDPAAAAAKALKTAK
jgi:hypothetical protein